MHALIIGASGEAGRASIRALTQLKTDGTKIFGQQTIADVYATTSKDSAPDVEEAKAAQWISGVDLTQDNWLSKLDALPGEDFLLIYTPARGPIGFPVEEATAEQVAEANAFSLDPLIAAEAKLKPVGALVFSAYYFLPHCLGFYGSLAYNKLALEKWALQKPAVRRAVRAGTFFSQSVRGITLLMRRLLKKTDHPMLLDLKNQFEKSDKDFGDFFLEHAWRHERDFLQKTFGAPHSPTDGATLSQAIIAALTGAEPIQNVIGEYMWPASALPEGMPAYLDEAARR